MMSERRLGRGLKGMNKSNLLEIENSVWPIIEREASLYQTQLTYQHHKKHLQDHLQKRREELMEEIQQLQPQQQEVVRSH